MNAEPLMLMALGLLCMIASNTEDSELMAVGWGVFGVLWFGLAVVELFSRRQR